MSHKKNLVPLLICATSLGWLSSFVFISTAKLIVAGLDLSTALATALLCLMLAYFLLLVLSGVGILYALVKMFTRGGTVKGGSTGSF